MSYFLSSLSPPMFNFLFCFSTMHSCLVLVAYLQLRNIPLFFHHFNFNGNSKLFSVLYNSFMHICCPVFSQVYIFIPPTTQNCGSFRDWTNTCPLLLQSKCPLCFILQFSVTPCWFLLFVISKVLTNFRYFCCCFAATINN